MANGMQPMNVQPPAQGQAMAQAPQAPQQNIPPQAVAAIQAKMQDPEFTAWFKQLPPDQQQQVLQRLAMDYSGQNAVVDEQLAAAEMLRNTQGAQGRQAGRVFTAANPLEHIASAYKQRQGTDQYNEALARKKELSDMQTQGLQDVMAAQLRGGSY